MNPLVASPAKAPIPYCAQCGCPIEGSHQCPKSSPELVPAGMPALPQPKAPFTVK